MIRITTLKCLREQSLRSRSENGLGVIDENLRDLLLQNPMSDNDGSEPVQILGVKADLIIGQMNLIRGQICVGGEKMPILWGSGYVVPPEHRGTGAGLMVLLCMHGLASAVGVVGASQMAAPLYAKLKWIDLVVPRYILPRRARPILERFLGLGHLSAAASAVCDLGLFVLGRWVSLVNRAATRQLCAEQVARMPDEWDAELSKIDKPASCCRSAAWLNWILSAREGSPALYLVKAVGGRTVGYFVISHRHHKEGGAGKWKNFVLGSVKDWMTFDSEVVSDTQLVRLAVNELLRRRVDAVDVCVAEPEVGLSMLRCGFQRVGGLRFSFRPLPNTALARQEFHNLKAWRFRPADGDYFLF